MSNLWCLPVGTRDSILKWAGLPKEIWESLCQQHQMAVCDEYFIWLYHHA